MKYQRLNVLSQTNRDYMSDDCIQQVANMINASGSNRSQRKRLERALNKVENIYSQAQKRVDRTAYREYQYTLDGMMVRFFSVLGIVLKNKYGFQESEDQEEISDMFNALNSQFEQLRDVSTEEISDMCFEQTGIRLIPTE